MLPIDPDKLYADKGSDYLAGWFTDFIEHFKTARLAGRRFSKHIPLFAHVVVSPAYRDRVWDLCKKARGKPIRAVTDWNATKDLLDAFY